MQMHRLAVVGLLSRDRVDGGPPRPGGVVYYAANALRFLGQPALIATKVGHDEEAVALRELGIPVVHKQASRTIEFGIENEGDRRRLLIREPGDGFTPADVREWLGPALAGSDWVHAGALTRGDFPADTLAELRRGRRLSFDGQGLVRSGEKGEVRLDADYDPEVLRHVDLLKLSEEETAALGLELDDRSLGSLGVREVVVTLGRDGVLVYADGLSELIPTRPVEGVDPTGAGDTFITAYLSHRRSGHSAPSAAHCANDAVRELLERRGRRTKGETRRAPR
jgi:sugar/nucleoside kinase (ribokinase family)